MQKNWYIIYTKPEMEKKVEGLLKKRKIESFVPVSSKKISSFKKTKIQLTPLFKSYVFVKLEENETAKIRSIEGVVNFVYWKGKPANIQEAEIELIKEFTADHDEIVVEKINVTEAQSTKVRGNPNYSLSGNVLTIKNSIAKVNLPSIGFSLVAKVEDRNHLQIEVPFGERSLLLQS